MFEYAFDRLRHLLQDIEPPKNLHPINLSIGEPQGRVPKEISTIITQQEKNWGRYPNLRGTDNFIEALKSWIQKRYGLAHNQIHTESLIPLSGTREGLFLAACHLVAQKRRQNISKPVVVYPNPFYHVYHAGALINDTTPVTYDLSHNILLQLEQIATAHSERIALIYVCNPNNPTGKVLSLDILEKIVQLARKHNFIVLFDECYSEIYNQTAPSGGLELLKKHPNLDGFWVMNSLSKRSGVPGLRCGFVYGPLEDMRSFARLRSHAAAVPSNVVMEAAAFLWSDEKHVIENRLHYQRLSALANSIFSGYKGFEPSEAGFFMWLNVAQGEHVAKRLWQEQALKFLPGSFMALKNSNHDKNQALKYIRS
ncbi:MAG: aminotransferase class I/II-fold pyridoxal phosphate-dependent enzyme, partial [Pseudomonadota bacterium]